MVKHNSEKERIIFMADAIMESGVCSSRKFNEKMFADLCGCSPAFLDSLLFEETGYDISGFISMCRIYIMKRLLLAGAEYKTALKSSGFRSPCRLERALDYVAI
jgi:methylphosphotriester-DNA--protein-cysteine methyltransferase